MPRKTTPVSDEGSFGDRLASLRQAAGLSQRQLEKLTGVSHRMIAYYEKRDAPPPGHVLTALSEAFGCSVDELLGRRATRSAGHRTPASRRLLRRLQQMEKLPLKDKRALLAIIDTYLEKHRLSRASA